MLHEWVTDAGKVKTAYDGNRFRKHPSSARNQVEKWNVSIMHSRVSHKYVLLLSKERNRGFFQMCRWNQDIGFFFILPMSVSLSLSLSNAHFPSFPFFSFSLFSYNTWVLHGMSQTLTTRGRHWEVLLPQYNMQITRGKLWGQNITVCFSTRISKLNTLYHFM